MPPGRRQRNGYRQAAHTPIRGPGSPLLAVLDGQGRAYQADKYAANTKGTTQVAKQAFLTHTQAIRLQLGTATAAR